MVHTDYCTGQRFLLYWNAGDVCAAAEAVWRWHAAGLIALPMVDLLHRRILAMEAAHEHHV